MYMKLTRIFTTEERQGGVEEGGGVGSSGAVPLVEGTDGTQRPGLYSILQHHQSHPVLWRWADYVSQQWEETGVRVLH